MGYFIIVILILAYIVESVQLAETQPSYVKNCWFKWRIVSEYQNVPSAWLNREYLVEEICKTGVSVDDMDKCTRQHVDVNGGNILAYWSGIREKYHRVCQHYREYLRYKKCRENHHVITAYNKCPKRYPGVECSDFESVSKCVKKAIKRHCMDEPAEFFTNLVDTELAPLLEYMGCSSTPAQPYDNVEHVRVKTRTTNHTVQTTVQSPASTVNSGYQVQGHRENMLKEEIIIKTEELEVDVTVYSSSQNTKCTTSLLLISLFVLLLH